MIRSQGCRSAVVLLLFLMAAALPAAAQPVCFGPDGLDGMPGVCCLPAPVSLPQFPAVPLQRIKYVCFDNCGIRINANICVDLSAPTPAVSGGGVVCGIYTIRYRVKLCNPAGTLLWTGVMRAQYSRTWFASSVAGAIPDRQVWRFLLNGDFVPQPALPPNNTCVRAPCAAAFANRIHVWGYIDYSQDKNNGTFETAWALNHGCDATEHLPGTSARPGAFHPNLSYTWIGPGTGFIVDPVNTNVSNGPQTVQEAVRANRWAALPNICEREELIQFASIIPQQATCPCAGAAGGPGQYVQSLLRVVGLCGTDVSLPPAAPIPFNQKRIGRWTIGATYPGLQELLLDEGFVNYQDGCANPPVVLQQYVKGVETLGGFTAMQILPPQAPLGRQFEDLATANRSPTNVALIVGAPYVSHFIINLNAP